MRLIAFVLLLRVAAAIRISRSYNKNKAVPEASQDLPAPSASNDVELHAPADAPSKFDDKSDTIARGDDLCSLANVQLCEARAARCLNDDDGPPICGCTELDTCVQTTTTGVLEYGCPNSTHTLSPFKTFASTCEHCHCMPPEEVAQTCPKDIGKTCGGFFNKTCPEMRGDVKCENRKCVCTGSLTPCSFNVNDGGCVQAHVFPFKIGEAWAPCITTKSRARRFMKLAGAVSIFVGGALASPFLTPVVGGAGVLGGFAYGNLQITKLSAEETIRQTQHLFSEKVCGQLDLLVQLGQVGKSIKALTVEWCIQNADRLSFCINTMSEIVYALQFQGAGLFALAMHITNSVDEFFLYFKDVLLGAVLDAARRGFSAPRRNLDFMLTRLLGQRLMSLQTMNQAQMIKLAACRLPRLSMWSENVGMKKMDGVLKEAPLKKKTHIDPVLEAIDHFSEALDAAWASVAAVGGVRDGVSDVVINIGWLEANFDLASKWDQLVDKHKPLFKKVEKYQNEGTKWYNRHKNVFKKAQGWWKTYKLFVTECSAEDRKFAEIASAPRPVWDRTACECFWCTRSSSSSCGGVHFRLEMPVKLGGGRLAPPETAGDPINDPEVCNVMPLRSWNDIRTEVNTFGKDIIMKSPASRIGKLASEGGSDKTLDVSVDRASLPAWAHNVTSVDVKWQHLLQTAETSGAAAEELWGLFRDFIGTSGSAIHVAGHSGYCREAKTWDGAEFKGCKFQAQRQSCTLDDCLNPYRPGCHLH